LYDITTAGSAEVSTWFASPIISAPPPRDELAIKLALAVTMPGLDVMSIIQTQRSASMQALQTYTRARAKAGEDLTWQLITQRLIFDTEAELRWLDECEAMLVQASKARPAKRAPAAGPLDSADAKQEAVR
jgi:hypothetical protein